MIQLNKYSPPAQQLGQDLEADVASLAGLIANGTMSEPLAGLLAACVHARMNILVCGGLLSGKTTLLRALASAIPPYERLVTVEDFPELGLDQDEIAHSGVITLQSRRAGAPVGDETTLAELVRWAQPLAPDRMIVGELRGAEVVPVLDAMNHGHGGVMAAILASNPRGAFVKLAAYAAQATEPVSADQMNGLIADALQIVIRPGWDRGGRRCIASVYEVAGIHERLIEVREVCAPGPDGRAVPVPVLLPETLRALVAAGYRPAEAGI